MVMVIFALIVIIIGFAVTAILLLAYLPSSTLKKLEDKMKSHETGSTFPGQSTEPAQGDPNRNGAGDGPV